ncbi:MAG: DUF1385 domain-containing protein [Clostridia bacterium]
MSNKEKIQHKTSVGGQALLEGIMMQGPKGAAIACRLGNGEIDLEELEVKHVKDKFKPLGLPIIRGVVNFIESMIFGYKCLMISANKVDLTDGEDEEEMSKLDKWLTDHLNEKVLNVLMFVASAIGMLIAFGLFFYLPTIAINWVNELANDALVNYRALLEGLIRMAIFILYMAGVSMMKDIKRTFMYHGAEHKTIFCYEHGEELTVENVRKQIRFHPRCGTSFIFVVLIISVVISSLLSLAFPELRDTTMLWIAAKISILPFIMGLSYEFIKYAGRHENVVVKVLAAPGLLMQRLTTKEPDDSMIEVAIAAFNAVITDNPEDDAV